MQSIFTIERKKRGISKKVLYQACNVSAQTWQKLEDFPKDFKITELEVIADYFKCSLIELIEIVGVNEQSISKDDKFRRTSTNTMDEIKNILQKENISWREFAKITNDVGQSNLKRNLEQWSNKINYKLDKIGYMLTFKRKE